MEREEICDQAPVLQPIHGRGALTNPVGRFEACARDAYDDGWDSLADDSPSRKTIVTEERGASIISYNESPDVGFDRSINPYRGCEHGCVYCFARPSHGYLGLSSGLDFESRLFAKVDAPALLDRELRKKNYKPNTVAVGVNTDCYQPIERQYEITRQVLKTLVAFGHPFGIITKSNLVLRDLDVIAQAAEQKLTHVYVSITTLDVELARKMEPRAPTPQRRLEAIAQLAKAGATVGVMAAPMVPGLNDGELESILQAARDAGAVRAGWVLLRLPHEIKTLFSDWLDVHHPGRADRVRALISDTRGGQAYDNTFGIRMRGVGPYADLLKQRFLLATQRLGLNRDQSVLRNDLFRLPPRAGEQLRLL